jgi:hypothetical protein
VSILPNLFVRISKITYWNARENQSYLSKKSEGTGNREQATGNRKNSCLKT